MIKINIASLAGELDIEIKQTDKHYNLLVIMSKSDYFQEDGKAWHAKIDDDQTILKIVSLIKACHTNPSIPKGITINDGTFRKISLEDTVAIHLLLKDSYHAHTNESELLKTIFEYVCEQIQDPVLEKYIRAFDDSK
ncbi:hypothetical protein E6C50_08585 [Flavobacterium supellecticarium]|uniref:Uncharacterized protein n=1 Tax=Flavobacterium supellecticarium TaxID=2565924 RepID=A0A4S4A0V0_9FLAO|nr:hypothetical protein [Flavobacterium supellecticarium]THF51802.1 hypothetical protein E6C50_08585 [Flavobacterium supellecticarium]